MSTGILQYTKTGELIRTYPGIGSATFHSISFDGLNFWIGTTRSNSALYKIFRLKNGSIYEIGAIPGGGVVGPRAHGIAALGGGRFLILKATSAFDNTPLLELRKYTLTTNTAIDSIALTAADPVPSGIASGMCFDGRFFWYYNRTELQFMARDIANWSVDVMGFPLTDPDNDSPGGICFDGRRFYVPIANFDVGFYSIDIF